VTHELVVYIRAAGCPLVTLARRTLSDYGVPYREIVIDDDTEARQRVRAWTGFLAVPTLVVSGGDGLPVTPPTPLPPGTSPRGLDRGDLITEPDYDQLVRWLRQHRFIAETPDDEPH
jgi:glutaredoxin